MMRIVQVGVLALSPLLGGASSPELPVVHIGTMTLYSPDGASHQDYVISSFQLSLQPSQAAEAQDPASLRSMTVGIADIGSIDDFIVAWITSGHARRHVVFTLSNPPIAGQTAATIKYDLDATEVTSFEAGYSDGGGQTSLAIDARHMTLNGNRLF